jgi:hypothetical protein
MSEDATITYNTEKFFKQLKENVNDHGFLKTIDHVKFEHHWKTLYKMRDKAEKAGQKHKVEKLDITIQCNGSVSKLLDAGFNKTISIKKLNTIFDQLADKDVAIFPLEDYTGDIPEEVADKIEAINAQELFDGMIVIGTDYTGEDKKYITKQRDPVLFGLLGDAKKENWLPELFFIADWEDDYVGLTLDEMVEAYERSGAKDKLVTKPAIVGKFDKHVDNHLMGDIKGVKIK